ncbi:hypothetical protein [Comamonas odontotermitis]|uniref:hypothetical protein n=1 Tax=Comamonas odontotermitis TaxID=379895 RepID=UPI001CC5E263|nr:hypothetical protein [Comamonas odontotermitis]UBB18312.1 hypothetical protein LAD35_06655 [Comamonas odontotermitis]
MTTKTTGAELKRFYNDPSFWLDGVWHEDVLILSKDGSQEDEISEIPDALAVSIAGGVVFYSGPGRAPWPGEDGTSFEAYFRRWRKTQNTAYGTLECPKDKLDAVLAAIKEAGGKVT